MDLADKLQIKYAVCFVLSGLALTRAPRLTPADARRIAVPLLLRSVLYFAFNMTWYAALARAYVGPAVAIVYAAPCVSLLIARAVLSEPLPRGFFLRLVLVVVGVVLISGALTATELTIPPEVGGALP